MMWFNGQFIDEAALSATSAGTLLGWGVFTTIGIWHARPFALDQHFARLHHDATRADIEYSISDETLRAALNQLIARQNIARGMARITLTRRGDGRWNMQNGSDISVVARQLPDENRPAKITISPFRVHSQRAMTGVKSTSYLDYQMAWQEAQSRGFDEAILPNERENLCEGARSNVFWTRDNRLFTPSLQSGCLPGIARALVLQWAREMEIEVCENEYSMKHLQEADSIFLTSAANGVRESHLETRDFSSCDIVLAMQKRWECAVQNETMI